MTDPNPFRDLEAAGFTLMPRRYTDGAFVSLTRQGLRVSRLAMELLGSPPALRVYRSPEAIALVPAKASDDKAYKITTGSIGSDGLRKRLIEDGWEHARYRGEWTGKHLLITKGKRT